MAGGASQFAETDESFTRPTTANGPIRSPCGITSRSWLRQL